MARHPFLNSTPDYDYLETEALVPAYLHESISKAFPTASSFLLPSQHQNINYSCYPSINNETNNFIVPQIRTIRVLTFKAPSWLLSSGPHLDSEPTSHFVNSELCLNHKSTHSFHTVSMTIQSAVISSIRATHGSVCSAFSYAYFVDILIYWCKHYYFLASISCLRILNLVSLSESLA